MAYKERKLLMKHLYSSPNWANTEQILNLQQEASSPALKASYYLAGKDSFFILS